MQILNAMLQKRNCKQTRENSLPESTKNNKHEARATVLGVDHLLFLLHPTYLQSSPPLKF